VIRSLSRTGEADHPALDVPGWWYRDCRLAWEPAQCCPSTLPARHRIAARGAAEPRAILVTGGGGALAQVLANVCIVRGLPHRVLSRAKLDVADAASIVAAFDRWRPWAVINAAGFSRVDRAEAAPELCWRENVGGAEALSRACAAAGIPLVAFSSHLVFGGDKPAPYLEGDPVAPLGVYAAAKAEAERVASAAFPDVLLIRSGSFFGPWDSPNTLTRAIRAVGSGHSVAAASDVTVSPTYLPDLADTTLDLLMDGERGIWHLASPGTVTWAELAKEAVSGAALDPLHVRAVPAAELGWRAPRPAQSALRSRRSALMPPLGKALGCYLGALRSGAGDIVTGAWLTRYRPPG